MRHDGAEDSGSITRRKGDAELLGLGVLISRFGADVLVDHLNELLKRHKLDDRVWNLSHPERGNTKVETSNSSFFVHEACGLSELPRELAWLSGLDSDFDGFPWTEEDISDDFGGG